MTVNILQYLPVIIPLCFHKSNISYMNLKGTHSIIFLINVKMDDPTKININHSVPYLHVEVPKKHFLQEKEESRK